QAQWRKSHFFAGTTYTFSKLRGNDSGETAANAIVRNTPGEMYYPEYFKYAARNPVGYLQEDTRHRVKAWAAYDFNFGRFGTFTPGLLQTLESGIPYSALGVIDATGRNNFTYVGIPVNPGYTLSNAGTQHN